MTTQVSNIGQYKDTNTTTIKVRKSKDNSSNNRKSIKTRRK